MFHGQIENLQKESVGNRIKKEKAKIKPRRDAILSCRECQFKVCNLSDIRYVSFTEVLLDDLIILNNNLY